MTHLQECATILESLDIVGLQEESGPRDVLDGLVGSTDRSDWPKLDIGIANKHVQRLGMHKHKRKEMEECKQELGTTYLFKFDTTAHHAVSTSPARVAVEWDGERLGDITLKLNAMEIFDALARSANLGG